MSRFEEERKLFEYAFRRFIESDKSLLENNASERALMFHLASYMKDYLKQHEIIKGCVIDCEYNRATNPSTAVKIVQNQNSVVDSEIVNKIVVPDIILHERGTNKNNIFVCELKKKASEKERKHDEEKICKIIEMYKYVLGIVIYRFNTKEIKMKVFKTKSIDEWTEYEYSFDKSSLIKKGDFDEDEK